MYPLLALLAVMACVWLINRFMAAAGAALVGFELWLVAYRSLAHFLSNCYNVAVTCVFGAARLGRVTSLWQGVSDRRRAVL